MSPEPLSVITVTTEGHSVNNEVSELRRQLDRERHARLHLEKEMREIQNQLYPERFRDNQLMTYQTHEVMIVSHVFPSIRPIDRIALCDEEESLQNQRKTRLTLSRNLTATWEEMHVVQIEREK